ncbi:type II toxin-antitoxin system RelE family toxin [Sediminispirochaeta bajacaliforniensis]|uniref:type II toxin-antitoxin system RelE family toxin n=1 Tax=Sediminispirochaeta bajacaliforniensis TaxID=148 RepID=UPI00146F662D
MPAPLFPQGVQKIVGKQNLYRIRSGNYRVIYSLKQEQLIIEVVRIGHRKDVYK